MSFENPQTKMTEEQIPDAVEDAAEEAEEEAEEAEEAEKIIWHLKHTHKKR